MKKYLPLVSIIFLGLILRLYNLGGISLWHDEAFSALLINYSWSEMFYRIGLDVHPSMYYVFLRIWEYGFGNSVFALRAMSAFFGVASIWVAWAFVKDVFKNEKAALWTAVLVAINPFQLHYVTEARMYTMGAFFALLASYFLAKALRAQKEHYSDRVLNMPNLPQDIKLKRTYLLNYLGFVISTAIIIQTHYYLLFTAAALCFYGLIYHVFHYRSQWRSYFLLLISYFLIFVSFLPWLKVFLFQYRQVGAGYWIPSMNRWSIPSTLWDMLLGIGKDVNKDITQWGLVLVTLFTIYLFYRFIRKTESFEKWLVALAIVAPFAGAVLFVIMASIKGTHSSVYLDRYFLFASIFYSISLAVWFKEIKIKLIGTLLFSLYVLVNLWTFGHYWSELNVSSKPGMAGAASFLKANVQPKDHIFVGTSFEFFNYKYYNQQLDMPVRPRLFTGGRADTSQISHVEGVAILSNQDLVPNFKEAVKTGDTVWLIWTEAFGSSKPETPVSWTQVDFRAYNDVRPYPWAYVNITQYKVN